MLETNQLIADFLITQDPIMQSIIQEDVVLQRSRDLDPFISLASIIVYQQLSGKVAGVIFDRLSKLLPEFTPTNLAALSDEQLRSIGLSGQKVTYLRSLSHYAQSNDMTFAYFEQLTDEQLLESLITIKGIGTWSAEMFMMFTLGRPDVFSIKDAGLIKAIRHHYQSDHDLSLTEIEAISLRWQPYRTYACLYLWNCLKRL